MNDHYEGTYPTPSTHEETMPRTDLYETRTLKDPTNVTTLAQLAAPNGEASLWPR